MPELKPFCNSCGLCCATMGKWVDAAKKTIVKTTMEKEIANFPYPYDKNGRCEKLGKDGMCTVYHKRPDICNIETIFLKHYKGKTTQKSFYALSKDACLSLQAVHHYTPVAGVAVPEVLPEPKPDEH